MKPQASARVALVLAGWALAVPWAGAVPELTRASRRCAAPGDPVTLSGAGFGADTGRVVLAGLRVEPDAWSDAAITFTVPDDGASGALRVRLPDGTESGEIPFSMARALPAGQSAPVGLHIADMGLPGAAFLVETDGSHLYGVSGFETLVVYELRDTGPHAFLGRFHLHQRVADLRVHDGHLFCVGDHGLTVYRCGDLRQGVLSAVAAVAGGSCQSVDIKADPMGEIEGAVAAVVEHAPRWGTNNLRVVFYQFDDGELARLGTFSREALAEERQFAVALDPLNRKAYVSGWTQLTGTNRYLLELSTTNLAQPRLHHREETAGALAADMEAVGAVLWAGLQTGGTERFRAYELRPGNDHLVSNRSVRGTFSFGRLSRVKIIDDQVTAGCSWFGGRPDVFVFDTHGTGTTPRASRNSLDWAFDVSGCAWPAGADTGRVFVADEWGGFLTYDYGPPPGRALTNRADYQWIVSAAMTENLHLAGDRIYVAGRGGGPWSADRFSLSDLSQWRSVDFDWSLAEPQPHPVSAVATRDDPSLGRLIFALGHEKAMSWGQKTIGLLYRETESNITWLAQSEEIEPPFLLPGLWSSGLGVVWPETDLVYMATGSDGFRAYLVDPRVPAVLLHPDCVAEGFDTNTFGIGNEALCIAHVVRGGVRNLLIGSRPGLLVAKPTFSVYELDYPDGVPDRDHTNAAIQAALTSSLNGLRYKSVNYLDVRGTGLVAVATSQGAAVFDLDWIPALNGLLDFQAWNLIRVDTNSLRPWWSPGWTAGIDDVRFGGDGVLYAVKAPYGVFRIEFTIDPANRTHVSRATAFYPGVECGMDYNRMLHGWSHPDIATLHHPYALAADGDTLYVTGWNGKVYELVFAGASGPAIRGVALDAAGMEISFFSPWGGVDYGVESATDAVSGHWTGVAGAAFCLCDASHFVVRYPPPATNTLWYRLTGGPLP